MRVAVDARALRSWRGVTRWVTEMLGALAQAHPEDEWLAVVPGRSPVSRPHPGVRLVRTRAPSRLLWGAAALAGRPRLADLADGADVCWIPAPAPVACGAPYVLTVHDRSWERRPRDFTLYERFWHAAARPRALARRAAVVTTISRASARDLAAAWGVEAEVVAPGVGAAPAGARPRPGRYLLWVGALEPRKGVDVMAAAWARARAHGLDAELLVAGAGREALAGPGVVAVGAVGDAELAALYAGALALVAPSRLEGFGMAPLEAGAHGTPSVVSDLDVFTETLGDAALRVAPDDPDALAGALLRIAGDAPLRARLGHAARERAASYDWERSAQALYELLARAAR
jgi:glycosyltransferase involved in cell wall biosynthesis